MNHLGVLLHSETQVLVLHGFVVEVDLWDGRDHFSKLQFLLLLLDICIGSWMLRYWLAAAFLCDVLRIVLRLVSIAVLWFALPAVGFALLPAVGCALLPAVGFAVSVHFIIPQIFNVLLAFLVPLLHSSFHGLVGCGSVSDSHHWLLGCGLFGWGSVCASSSESLCGSLRLRGSFLASPNTTTQRWATS